MAFNLGYCGGHYDYAANGEAMKTNLNKTILVDDAKFLIVCVAAVLIGFALGSLLYALGGVR